MAAVAADDREERTRRGMEMRTSVRPAAFWPFVFSAFSFSSPDPSVAPVVVVVIVMAIAIAVAIPSRPSPPSQQLLFSAAALCHWRDTCINILTACRLRPRSV